MRRRGFLFALTILILSLAVSAGAAEYTRDFAFEAGKLTVDNLVGRVEVVPTDGDDFKVTVAVRGAEAEEGLLEFVVDEGREARLEVRFPIEEHENYVYPELGRGSKTSIHIRDDDSGSWIKKIFSGIYGKKVTVRGRGNGLEMWADVTIEVPRGRELEVYHGVGRIDAEGARADLVLETRSGPIRASSIEGDLLCDTGSGSVAVESVTGNVLVDTGSGGVTGRDLAGDEVRVDTGSGSVELARVDCASLTVDTGSGSVEVSGARADRAGIDTGSGDVELVLDRMGDGRFVIDTGSGSIDLVLPADASAHITADTGSGRVRNEVHGAEVRLQERDEIDMVVGGGEARVKLDAGSGSVTVSQG